MSLINTQIKPFSATAYQNGKFIDINQDTLKGKWSAIVFYPADFTFVCPTELGRPRRQLRRIPEAGRRDLRRVDRHPLHAQGLGRRVTRHQEGQVPHGRRPDRHAVANNFEVMIEEAGLALRGTFVINPEGQIKVLEVLDLGIGRDAKELLRKIKAAQYVASHPGEVCPAKWSEGAKTLTPSLDLVGKI